MLVEVEPCLEKSGGRFWLEEGYHEGIEQLVSSEEWNVDDIILL